MGAAPAFADATADGAAVGSPGAVSGNTIQLPVHVPVNACGNTVNVVGLLNPAAGNTCANQGSGPASTGYGEQAPGGNEAGTSTSNGGGATAEGAAVGSPGVVSGNGVQLPVDLPVNVSGNTVDVVGVGNPVFGNHAENVPAPKPPQPPVRPERPVTPKPEKPPVEEPVKHAPHTEGKPPVEIPEEREQKPAEPAQQAEERASLAQTGADPLALAAPAALALLGGTLLHRRFRRQREN